MTNIIEIIIGDYLYIKPHKQKRARRVKVTQISSNDLIYGDLYNRSEKVYEKVEIDLSIVTGVRLISRKRVDMDQEFTALIVCEIADSH